MAEKLNYNQFKGLYLLEEQRIASFRDWPFDENTTCSIAKMAEAGFYWSGNERENDTVSCFVCAKTLDGWESTDEPWKEHAKHAPQCLFVKYGKSEGELTVEDFLNIFSDVIQNDMTNKLEKKKKEVTAAARNELSAFIEKK